MSAHKNHPTPDQIAALAHQFWEAEGRPEGRGDAHWKRAEEILQDTVLQPPMRSPSGQVREEEVAAQAPEDSLAETKPVRLEGEQP